MQFLLKVVWSVRQKQGVLEKMPRGQQKGLHCVVQSLSAMELWSLNLSEEEIKAKK